MGRKRWWHGGLELLLLCMFHRTILGDGNIGCLYSSDVCEKKYEFCFNDKAFGTCLPVYDNFDKDDAYEYDLSTEEQELLQKYLDVLEFNGYKWAHPYTQCVLQVVLLNIRYRTQDNVDGCSKLENHQVLLTNDEEDNGDDFINSDEEKPYDLETQESEPLAIVKFTPSKVNPHGEYADEVYYPPGYETNSDLRRDDRRKRNYPVNFQDYTETDSYDRLAHLYPNENAEQKLYSTPVESVYPLDDQADDLIPPDYSDTLEQIITSASDDKNKFDYDETEDDTEYWPGEILETVLSQQKSDPEENNDEEDTEDYEKTFSRKYKYPRYDFSESEDSTDSEREKVNSTEEESGGKNIDFLVKSLKDAMPHWKELYTEGGVVQSDDNDDEDEETEDDENDEDEDQIDEDLSKEDKELSEDFKEMLRRELAGFKRRERLDVKKPGPPFSNFNYGVDADSSTDDVNMKRNGDHDLQLSNDAVYSKMVKKESSDVENTNSENTDTGNAELSYDNVDRNHVYVETDLKFNTWDDGKHFVKEISKKLGLKGDVLKDIRVGRAEVTFEVVPNNKNYSADDVVEKMDTIANELQKTFGFHSIAVGIGDKVKLQPVWSSITMNNSNSFWFGTIMAIGITAAFLAAVVVLLLIRSHVKSRAKLNGVASDPEASKDYQELCRARMQVKQQADKSESPRAFRLINRVYDSNNSASNRSSTSSWGEEPAPTNLDISTGHMVLSYMEDHLKNQDKLDEEWAAVCAYEAEPCSTTIAEKPENNQYNRPGAALPYDHSRVVLNDLTSVSNSNYINASTITDHDPRNPAYIATQGPLPQTAAHFWQLVWEQGSVVILMLTRLTEEGKAMCHRYWPEEGSELYHIYEVHLVSEHIWCDDYLVRSFYLKNLRTGETRTVTQFHFLSWSENSIPQSTKALLEFRRKVNKSYRGRSCPIVVHCSDGAGRTGTYCLIDMVLNRMMKGAKEIDIAATLEHIRDQRQGMVANKRQFEFVLMAVAEEVHAILKALPIPPAEKSPTPSTNDASSSKLVSFDTQPPTSKSN